MMHRNALIHDTCPTSREGADNVDESRHRTTNSFGLGLAIAKEIVELHHGKIGVDSTKENGTLFTVVFPISNMVKKLP